ncbi:sister chromatid cohesion factor PDS5 ASCRUDRAFT_28895 [Ascoidea rubescens DSM 1968]|uniref:Sister chromatid cohesion protein PDS5 n=1 Tax=Ascoidea rubescens DSM 1968 TaxID=1344418 RepID=A0A1D2VRM1_9ASCO|nr:hypothetical protein ASCRUDRAFT_28895 [Ascoidea rubescens DSM 1968]ODV64256.1 hypothetical protein ASCRUDRAFT_28895 [Ascoidea rubescens DSM 1968]
MAKSASLQKLKFKESIIPTIKDPISAKVLLNRLTNLFNELTSVDQEKVDLSTFDAVKKDLVNQKLLKHNDQGVSVYVASCIADLLRIYAPDAPFTANQLTDIFKLFLKNFKNLGNPDGPYYDQVVYLLKRLAEVRSIILITDLPKSESLIEKLFDLFYNVLSTKNVQKNLIPVISMILGEVIAEAESIPLSVLKLILNKFLTNTTNPSNINLITSSLNISSPSFAYTVAICQTNSDRLSAQLNKFISDILNENIRLIANDEEEDDDIDPKVAMKNLEKVHKLIVEIWKYVPDLLSSVMGLIDDELLSDDVKQRVLATEAIGKIIVHQSPKVNFVVKHHETWIKWLKKTLDISPQVRIKWIEESSKILVSRTDLIADISNGISKSLIDSDEKVRLSACKMLNENLQPSVFISRFSNNITIMKTLGQLVREKHSEIRNEAIKILGNLYNYAINDLISLDLDNFSTIKQKDNKKDDSSDLNNKNDLVSWIPNSIFNLIYINDKEINYSVDITLFEHFFPIESNNEIRVKRLLYILNSLDDRALKSFQAFNKRQKRLSEAFLTLLNLCEKFNGGTISDQKQKELLEKNINKVLQWLCVQMPGNLNTYNVLDRFVKLNNRRLFHLIKLCVSSDSDYETIKNSLKELFNRLTDSKTINNLPSSGQNELISVSTTDMIKNFKLFMYRSSVIFFNKSNISIIMSYTKDETSPFNRIANEIIEQISNIIPNVFQNHIHDGKISEDEMEVDKPYDINIKSLKASFLFFKRYPSYLPTDEHYFNSLKDFSINGSPLEAKYAIKIICLSKQNESLSSSIFKELYPLNYKSSNFVTSLSTIAELFLYQKSLVEPEAAEITSYLIKEVLLENRVSADDENDPDWIRNGELENKVYDECYAKVFALKVFVNRLKSLESEPNAEELAVMVLKLFVSLISNGGEIVSKKSANWPTPKHFQAILRLNTGLMFLKLAKLPVYSKMIRPSTISTLIFLIQDENINVRKEFVTKLKKYLNNQVISERFIPLIFFIAHEPNDQFKLDVRTWIKSSFNRKLQIKEGSKDITFERSFVRLLHLITHHHEFIDLNEKQKAEDNKLFFAYSFAMVYISFYLDCIATQENISLLYYFSNRIKQYRDALVAGELYELDNPPDSIYSIYRVSELACMLIKALAKQKNWILQTWPGKIQLFADLFSPMQSTKEAQKVASTVFIKESILKRLQSQVETETGIKKHVKIPPTTPAKRGRKRKSIEKTPSAKKDKKMAINTPVRRSSRARKIVNYAGDSESEGETGDEFDGESSIED